MRKRKLRKDIKIGSIVLCIVIIGAMLIFLYIRYKNPGFDEEKVSLYNYESQGKVTYEVLLKPNSLYDKMILGEDEVYLSNLVDTIDTTYSYNFMGERAAEINGSYEILAVMEGYSGEGDKLITLWKKEIPLLTKTSFNANDSKITITKKVPLKLENFNDIAKRISDESKVISQTKVTTFMNVELSIKTDKGVIEKSSTSSIEVPLVGSYFRITKKQSENKPEALEEVKKVPRSIDIKLLTLFGTGIGISAFLLMILLFGTQTIEIDKFTKNLKKIFKKHGSRFVAIDSEISATSELQSKVRSMEDLVKISDELGKPIIYKHSYNYKENSRFWVIDEDRFYVFELEVSEPKGHSLRDRVNAKGTNERSNRAIPHDNNLTTLEERKNDFAEVNDSNRQNDSDPKVEQDNPLRMSRGHSFKDRVKANGSKERGKGDGAVLNDNNPITQEESKNDLGKASDSKRKNDRDPKLGTWTTL